MKLLLRILGLVALALAALWLFGPREPVPKVAEIEVEGELAEIAARFAKEEAALGDVTPGAEKRIVFAGEAARTDWAVVYIHGFSATSEEIRPVPDDLAKALGANLFYTRLSGHGRTGDALAQATVADWAEDMAEALALGRKLGDKLLVMSTSAGASLTALSASHLPDAADYYVFVSPNFALQAAGSALLTLPFARSWVPMLVGEERSWEAKNADHAKFWTNSYPTEAVIPLAALTKAAREADYRGVKTPTLVFLSDEDKVVSAATSRVVLANWEKAEIVALQMGAGDDPSAHVIAGRIMSPGQTDGVVQEILEWLKQ